MLSKLSDLIRNLRASLVYDAADASELRATILDAMTALHKLHDEESNRQYNVKHYDGPVENVKPSRVFCVRLLANPAQNDRAGIELFFVGNTVTPSKIMAIKQLRTFDSLGLKEAKDILDAAQDHAQIIGYSGIATL